MEVVRVSSNEDLNIKNYYPKIYDKDFEMSVISKISCRSGRKMIVIVVCRPMNETAAECIEI